MRVIVILAFKLAPAQYMMGDISVECWGGGGVGGEEVGAGSRWVMQGYHAQIGLIMNSK